MKNPNPAEQWRKAEAKAKRELIPSEAREQQTVAMWLDYHKICWFHPANETGIAHGYGLRRKMAQAGVKPGVPDIIIIDPPPRSAVRGAVIEMKRRKGATVQASQRTWLACFGSRQWLTAICYGADSAIAQLAAWGYGQ